MAFIHVRIFHGFRKNQNDPLRIRIRDTVCGGKLPQLASEQIEKHLLGYHRTRISKQHVLTDCRMVSDTPAALKKQLLFWLSRQNRQSRLLYHCFLSCPRIALAL